MCQRTCTPLCGVIGVILGLIVGGVVGVLFNFELLPGFVALLPTVLALGAGALVLLLVGLAAAVCRPDCTLADCLDSVGIKLAAGAIGTIAGALLSLLFAGGTLFTLQLILAAITAFFVTYLAVQVVCFVLCITRRL